VAHVLFGTQCRGQVADLCAAQRGQIPVYHYHKPSGGRSQFSGDYVDLSTKPLYAFGFGLSYTRSNTAISK